MVCPPPAMSDDDSGDKTAVLNETAATLAKEMQKAKEQEACLIIIRGTPQGHRFFLTQDEMTIGRDATADICLADQSISRKHAKVIKSEGKYKMTDLGSANGTWINDRRVAPG